jgi:hypothetical protein
MDNRDSIFDVQSRQHSSMFLSARLHATANDNKGLTDMPANLSLLFAVLLSVTLLTPQDFCGEEILLADNFL